MRASLVGAYAVMALAKAGIRLQAIAFQGFAAMIRSSRTSARPSRNKYTGKQLREIRARNGVGRPPQRAA